MLAIFIATNANAQQQKKLTTAERFQKEYVNKNTADEVIFYAYISDPDPNPTNIRATPGGKVIKKIDPDETTEVKLLEVWNGWFRISTTIEVDMEEVTLPGEQAWLHGSVLGLMTRFYYSDLVRAQAKHGKHYGKLFAKPDRNSKVVCAMPSEELSLSLVDMQKDWMKVRYIDEQGKYYIGWIEMEWLCANPYSTCP